MRRLSLSVRLQNGRPLAVRPRTYDGQSCRIEGRDPDLHGSLAAHGVEVYVDGGTGHKFACRFRLYLQSRAKLRSVNRAHEPIDFRLAVRMPPSRVALELRGRTCSGKEALRHDDEHHSLAAITLVFS